MAENPEVPATDLVTRMRESASKLGEFPLAQDVAVDLHQGANTIEDLTGELKGAKMEAKDRFQQRLMHELEERLRQFVLRETPNYEPLIERFRDIHGGTFKLIAVVPFGPSLSISMDVAASSRRYD